MLSNVSKTRCLTSDRIGREPAQLLLTKQLFISMAKKIQEIEGIGPAYQEKLEGLGIKTVEKLLEAGKDRKGRSFIEEQTGIEHKRLLSWVNMADLFRINGVGGQFAELLKRAGVDTVKELAQRNAANLHAKLVEVNDEKKLAKAVPALSRIETFIEEAKTMDQVVTH